MKMTSSMLFAVILVGSSALSSCSNDASVDMPTHAEMEAAQAEAVKEAKKRGWIDLKPLTKDDLNKTDAEEAPATKADKSSDENP